MKKYLIFDLDWTLIKSNKIWLKQILHYIKKIDKNYLEKAKYIFTTTMWMNIFDQLKLIFDDKNMSDKEIKHLWEKMYKRIRSKEDKMHFFKWTEDKIKKLSKKYKLFLTTWNSTQFAKDILKEWWIIKCFELIYWSDEIKKWKQHLDIFKNYSENDIFFKESIYFWDGDMDQLFAKESWIDFVRIWDFEEEENYVLESIAYIDNILDKYN
jgi:phosphoglycolate phosphatase-like HAD superfamily hydrolase